MSGRRTFQSLRKLPSGNWQAMHTDPLSRCRIVGARSFTAKTDAALWLSEFSLAFVGTPLNVAVAR